MYTDNNKIEQMIDSFVYRCDSDRKLLIGRFVFFPFDLGFGLERENGKGLQGGKVSENKDNSRRASDRCDSRFSAASE